MYFVFYWYIYWYIHTTNIYETTPVLLNTLAAAKRFCFCGLCRESSSPSSFFSFFIGLITFANPAGGNTFLACVYVLDTNRDVSYKHRRITINTYRVVVDGDDSCEGVGVTYCWSLIMGFESVVEEEDEDVHNISLSRPG